jgi:6-phosphogluconolactonase
MSINFFIAVEFDLFTNLVRKIDCKCIFTISAEYSFSIPLGPQKYFSKQIPTMQNYGEYPFYVGTYIHGASEGIYKYALLVDGNLKFIRLVAQSVNPSFLAFSPDRRFLMAVNEISNEEKTGTIESFSINDNRLIFISRSNTGGAHPCFVTVNNDGYVLVANYTGGNVGLLKLDSEGNLSDLLDIQQHYGKGTSTRQEGPHAHSAWFEPGSNRIISVDLGTNELWFSRLDENEQKLIPEEPQKLEMSAGAGPRHLSFHPNGKWIFVLNELDNTVTELQKTEHNNFEVIDSFSCLPPGFSPPNTAADLHISSDGKFLYASNRGHDSIAIFQIDPDTGRLTLLGHQLVHGSGPRSFSLSPDENYLVVANQHTNNMTSFERNQHTGMLKYISQIEAPSPVCILF